MSDHAYYSAPRHVLPKLLKIFNLTLTSHISILSFAYDNTQLFLHIDVMIAMLATSNMAIFICMLFEHILKLVLGALM